MALWVSKGADVLEGTSWILSVFICMYRESCPEFMYTSTISSLYFPPSSFITQTVCLFVLAGSFPVIPPFPTLYSFYQSPAATWIEAYLDYMKVLLLKNRPKKVPRTLFWDNIFCLLFHCHFHCFAVDNALWVIFLWQCVFFWQIHRTQFLLLSPVWPRFVLFSRDIFKTL